MITRYSASFGSAALITLGLLLVMQAMIATGPAALTERIAYRIVDFVRVATPPPPVETRKPLERIPEPAVRPPLLPPERGGTAGPGVAIRVPTGPTPGPPTRGGLSRLDGDLLPIVKVQPSYPPAALRRELEGYVIVRFTVTRTGAVTDVVAEESSNPIFERAAIEAAYRFRYRPRVINGEGVDVEGVRNRVTFEIDR